MEGTFPKSFYKVSSTLLQKPGLICNVCKMSKDSECKKEQDRCVAKPGESCTTISYYFESRHVFSKQGCMRQCKEKQYNRGRRLTYVMCCDKNLCNSF
ncbi:prostate and testis expressed protein 4 [Mus pahari]|uniref:prostate and testis expressed protein 4 n=1 Tax=Mus pahari TaxID=10093 RepID=UPI000A30D57E|nr:prostate and testis expressed protein 4 [Mus pahari]